MLARFSYMVLTIFLLQSCQSSNVIPSDVVSSVTTSSIKAGELEGKWKLKDIVSTEGKSLGIPKSKYNHGKSEYFLTIKGKEYSYNLDANSCWGKLSYTDLGELNMESGPCTEKCCDSVDLSYWVAKKYKVVGFTLYLVAHNETFVLERVSE